MINLGTAFGSIVLRAQGVQQGVNQAIQSINRLPGATKGAADQLSKVYQDQYFQVRDLGLAFGALATTIGSAFAYAVDSSVQWESAMADVQKTTNSSDAELSKLSDQLFALASRKPIPSADLAHIAAEAGALGLRGDQISDFTGVIADLAATTNLTADDATTGLARVGNIVGVVAGDYSRMGSTILELGRDTAATETEIANMSKRIAGAGKTVGLTADQIFAYSAALASVGVREEQGGSAISRTFIDIASAASKGGEDLNLFAQVAGMSADQFKQAFAQDAAGTTAKFIDGLGRIQEAGGNVFGVLESLGITEVRQRDAILRLASAHGLLDQTLGIGAKAWEENSALADIANKRYQTAAAQLEILKNQAFELAAGVGDSLLPVFKLFVGVLSSLVFGLQSLPGPLKFIYAAAFSLIGVVAALAVGFVFLAPRIRLAKVALDELKASSTGAGIGISVLQKSLGWITALLTVATVAVSIFGSKQKEASNATAAMQKSQDDLNAAIERNIAGNNTQLKAWALQQIITRGLKDDFDNLGISLDEVTNVLSNQGDEGIAAFQELRKKLNEAPHTEATAKLIDQFYALSGQISSTTETVQANEDAMHAAGLQTDADAEAQQKLADEYDKTKSKIDAQNNALIALVDAQRGARSAEISLIDAKEKERDAADKLAHVSEYQTKAELELTQAQQNVGKAQRDLAEAEKTLANARQAARDKVTDAESALYDAQDRSYEGLQKIRDAEAAYQALQGANYQLQVTKATNAYNDALSKLAHSQQDVEDAQWQINYLMQEGASARDIADAQQALVDANNQLADSTTSVTDAQNDLNDLTDPVKVANRLADAQRGVEKAYRDEEKAQRDALQAQKDLDQARSDLTNDVLYKEAQDAVTQAQLAVIDANLGVQAATITLQNLQSGQIERDYTNAQLNLEDAYYRLATANVEVQKQTALSQGQLWTSEDAVRALRDQLWGMSSDAVGPISDNLRIFGGTLVANTLPRDIAISVNPNDAIAGLDNITDKADKAGDKAGKAWYDSFFGWVGSGLSTVGEWFGLDQIGSSLSDIWSSLPWGADGGLVTKPTIMGLGEAGPELLLPLNNMNRTFQLMRDAGLLDAMKKKMLSDSGMDGIVSLGLMGVSSGQSGSDGSSTTNNVRHGDKWNMTFATQSDANQISTSIAWKRRVKTR